MNSNVQAQPAFGDPSRQLVLVTTVTPWDEIPRIRHQVTRQLRRFFNVLYVQLPFGSSSRQDSIVAVHDNQLVYRPARLPRGLGRVWNNVPAVHHAYNRRLAGKIEATLNRLGYRTAALVTFQYNFGEIMASQHLCGTIYLCNDDFSVGARGARQLRMLDERERRVAAAADLCLCVSTPLVRKISAFSNNVELFLPGHEFDAAAPAHGTGPGKGPVRAAFMGYLNDRLRFDWLERIGRDPDIDLTLVGPVEDRVACDALAAAGHARLLPPARNSELRDILKAQDVLLMPYDAGKAAVRAITAPNKLFQYLACGKPVVATELPDLISLPDKFLYRAASADDFLAAIHRAAREDDAAAEAERLRYAAENTWDRRGEHLRQRLTEVMANSRRESA